MVILVGIFGFIAGFLIGQMMLAFLLNGRSKDDILKLLKDRRARFKYGMINWLCAIVGAALFISTYKRYFLQDQGF